jgi:hypothetical protein
MVMSQTVDVDTLNNILQSLVTKPEDVKINRQLDELGVLLSIQVDPQDMGIVIGRNGAMATAIKTVMKAVGKANNMNLRVQFLEPDGSLKYTRKNPSKETKVTETKETKKEETVQDDTPSLEDDLKDFVIS